MSAEYIQNEKRAFMFRTYSMFHVTWTTFKFNGNQLGTASVYVVISVPWSNQRAHWVISGKLLSKEFHCRTHRMDKRKSFVFARQYRNRFSQRINALSAQKSTNQNSCWHSDARYSWLETMIFHRIADIAYFWLTVTEIIQFFSRNVTSETCCKA